MPTKALSNHPTFVSHNSTACRNSRRSSIAKRRNMVVPLGPGKFYGSSLPRPRIYNDTRFNTERVDPPVPVLDPLLSWANEAHWSMGGLSFKRLRLQGRIEGNVKRLKAQREKLLKESPDKDFILKKNKRDATVSPPPAPVAVKRRRFLDLNDEVDEESENEGEEIVVKREEKRVLRRGAVRKLGDDFERVAKDSGVVGKREKNFSDGIGGDVMKIVEEIGVESEIQADNKKKKNKKIQKVLKKGETKVQSSRTRTSPRLAKRGVSISS